MCRSRDFTCLPIHRRATWSSLQMRLQAENRQIEAWLLQARISIVASFNWAPWWQRKRVQRWTLARDASPVMSRIITTTGRDHWILPLRETEYDREKSNNIPTTQLSAIISQRTYNQLCDLTPESAIPRTEGEGERRLWVSRVATTSLRIEQSGSTSIVVYAYNSGNLEKARRTAKTTKAIGLIPIIPILGIQNWSSPICPMEAAVPTCPQRRGFQRKSTKAETQTGHAVAAAVETTKPTLYQIYMATCSESKHKLTAVQWASVYHQAYLGNSSFHTHHHSPPPWPGDDVCKESNGQSLGSVFEHHKQVDESEVSVIPMKAFNLVLGVPWQETQKSTGAEVDWQPYEHQMDCNGRSFQKQIGQVLCRNALK